MNFIKNLFKLLTIYAILLSIYIGLTLYLRPDIKIQDFLHNVYYWIGPLILLYVVLNFKKIFYGIINKIIIVFLLFLGANHFFPDFLKSLQPYIGGVIPSPNSIKKSANEILTPKNGMEPKYQFEINNKNQNKDKKIRQHKEESAIIEEPQEAKPLPEVIDVLPVGSNNQSNQNGNTSDIVQDIKELPSKAMEVFPKEAKDKLKEAGVDLENPANTLENIQEKKKDLKDSFFK